MERERDREKGIYMDRLRETKTQGAIGRHSERQTVGGRGIENETDR